MSTEKHMLQHGIALPESQEQQSEAISFQSAHHMQRIIPPTASDCRAALIQPSISSISTIRQTNNPGALHHLFSHRARDRYTIAPSAIRTHCLLENNLVRTYVNSIYPFSNRPLERAIFSVIPFTASNRSVYALVSLPILSLWNIVIAASGNNAKKRYRFFFAFSIG